MFACGLRPRANLLDFEAVKSFHNFHTKPATLRDRHLFWKALWRALLFPWCRTWYRPLPPPLPPPPHTIQALIVSPGVAF